MLDLGTVKPGSTIRIPFSSFDKDDGSSITMTNFAAADILIYKDGSTTERASTSGFTATTDFDSKTGKHLIVIDLADDTTADFYKAGSEYLVAVDAVTIDTVTTGGWVARFRIGYPGSVLDTSIATLSSQTSFTLTAGPAEDDALNGMWAIIHDKASAVQAACVLISDYTGASKTVTLAAGATFTVAAIDNISVMGPMPLQPTVGAIQSTGRALDVSTGGEAGTDWANIGSPTTTVNLSGTTVKTATDVETDTQDIQGRLPAALTAGGNMKSDAVALSGDTTAADNAESFFDGTGYAGTNNVIPTVTSVTNQVTANATAISGDTTAADNLEAMLDGTGGVTLTTAIVGNITGNLSGSVGSVTGNVGGNVAGSVASVTGNVGGNVVGSVASVTGNVGGNVIGTVASVVSAVAITSNVKKNQALASFTFLMTDSTNHAPATGLTVTCTRSIDGAAFASGTLANVAEVANGIYKVDFGSGDLNGNTVILKATATGADTTFERIVTQP